MGRYSLLAYIVQIAALQLLRRALRAYPLDGPALAVLLVLTIAGTVVAVEIAHILRRHSALVDRLYRTAFA